MLGNREKKRKRETVGKRWKWWHKKKIAMLLPRGEEKSEQDGLIAFHR